LAAVPSIGRASFVERSGVAPQAAATEGLYERHAAKLLSYCLHQLGSREEAEDAVQTTYMNAFRALGRGIVPEAESAWLFKIAENVCLSRRRSSWRRGRIESPSDFEIIEEIVPGPSRQNDELIGIEDALASMPEQQRRAILLREWQGLSYREIAEELEVTQSAVETLIFRARRSLAQGLEQPDTVKKPKRKSFRRALHALDVGTIVAALKTLLAGSAAVKATAAAVAVTAAAGTAYGVETIESKPPTKSAAPAKTLVSKPAASISAPVSSKSSFVASTASGSSPARAAKPAPAAKPKTALAKSEPAHAPLAHAPVVSHSADQSAVPAAATPVEDAPAGQAPAPAAAEQPAAEQAPAPAATHPAEQPRSTEGAKDTGKTDEGSKPKGRVIERVDPTTPVEVIVPTAGPAQATHVGSPAKAEPVAGTHAVTIVPTPVAPAIVTSPTPAPVATTTAPAAPTPVATTRTHVEPVSGQPSS
jgi:RNA polymerase sigma factor (sigma-70 family)